MFCFYTISPEILLNKTDYKTFLIGIKTYVALTLMVQRGPGQQTDPTNLIIYQSGHLINYQSGHLINYQFITISKITF